MIGSRSERHCGIIRISRHETPHMTAPLVTFRSASGSLARLPFTPLPSKTFLTINSPLRPPSGPRIAFNSVCVTSQPEMGILSTSSCPKQKQRKVTICSNRSSESAATRTSISTKVQNAGNARVHFGSRTGSFSGKSERLMDDTVDGGDAMPLCGVGVPR